MVYQATRKEKRQQITTESAGSARYKKCSPNDGKEVTTGYHLVQWVARGPGKESFRLE